MSHLKIIDLPDTPGYTGVIKLKKKLWIANSYEILRMQIFWINV